MGTMRSRGRQVIWGKGVEGEEEGGQREQRKA